MDTSLYDEAGVSGIVRKIRYQMIYIYCYTNITNGKVYIGQTENISKRAGKNGIKYKSSSTNFYSAILTDGWNNFSCATITTVSTGILADYAETRLIAQARLVLGWDNVYNIADGATPSSRGKKASDETRLKMSKAKIGHKHSDETIEKMSKSQIGKQLSDETKEKMSKVRKGKPKSEETKKKMSIAQSNMSDETKKKMSDAKKGIPWTEARRQAQK